MRVSGCNSAPLSLPIWFEKALGLCAKPYPQQPLSKPLGALFLALTLLESLTLDTCLGVVTYARSKSDVSQTKRVLLTAILRPPKPL